MAQASSTSESEAFYEAIHRFARSKNGLKHFSDLFDYNFRSQFNENPDRHRRLQEVAPPFNLEEYYSGLSNEWHLFSEANQVARRIFPRQDWRTIAYSIYASGLFLDLKRSPATGKTRHLLQSVVSKPVDTYLRGAKKSTFIDGSLYFRQLFYSSFLTSIAEVIIAVGGSYGLKPEQKSYKEPQPSSLIREIRAAAAGAPSFKVQNGRIRHVQRRADRRFLQRKSVLRERVKNLALACATRVNEQAELHRLVGRYAQGLRSLTESRGGYKLHLIGLDIEALLKIKAASPVDPDRNPILDPDLMLATQSLMVAHAGLMATLPDIAELSEELDRYQAQLKSLDALRDRTLESVLSKLADAPRLLDEKTQALTREIAEADDARSLKPERQSRAVVSTKHGWLRGALTAIGQFALTQAKAVGKIIRDEGVKELVKQYPKTLLGAAVAFLSAAGSALQGLAEALPATFGWVTHLLRLLGIL